MKKNIFYCIILVALISSCSEKMETFLDVIPSNNQLDLSEAEALTVAKTFHFSVASDTKTRANDITFRVKNAYRFGTSQKTRAISDKDYPLIYEISVNDGLNNGKVIVSGDKRFPEVLAYIPSFNDSLNEMYSGPNVMIQMAKEALLNKIKNYKVTPSTRSHTESFVPGEVSVMIVPFCPTNWFQGAPYNQLLPKAWIEYTERILITKPGYALYGNYPTGQAAVAIAQAMAYLRPNLVINGLHIDWEALTTENTVTSQNEHMVATLFKYIYDTVGTYPVWSRSYSDIWPESDATMVDAVIAMETPIKNISRIINSSQMGLICDTDQKWNLDIVKNSILAMRPVFVGDMNKVAFLVDGYAINEENSFYLHCNFGRYKGFNGYYQVHDGEAVFEPGGWLYRDIYLYMIANIRNR